jgi:predicted site-specific integrase-resolvase
MKLSQYAQKVGVIYRTAWLWYNSGKIKGYQMPTGTIVITEDEQRAPEDRVEQNVRLSR